MAPASELPQPVERQPEGEQDVEKAKNINEVYVPTKEDSQVIEQDCDIDESEQSVIDTGDERKVQAETSTAAVCDHRLRGGRRTHPAAVRGPRRVVLKARVEH
mmetsp:Transcript_68840/g.194276  ORF Transcript_68840/g.194276 Transcript_68840/m.194276 type:complete len:103 (+) Transcript_68840:194-502(+)